MQRSGGEPWRQNAFHRRGDDRPRRSGPKAEPATISLDVGWLFGGVYQTGSEAPDSPTADWVPVDLPHCVVPLSWRNWIPERWQNRWIYRRTVELPANMGGQGISLDFEGSMTSTTPFVNGTELPQPRGGYLPFSYDITTLVVPGANQLAVVVDGTWQGVPPDGRQAAGEQNPAATIDYLEPAGTYRPVRVRLVQRRPTWPTFSWTHRCLPLARSRCP